MSLDRRMLLLAPLGLTISNCAGSLSLQNRPSDWPTYEDLIRQIKFDVGTYIFKHQEDKPMLPPLEEDATPEQRAAYAAEEASGNYRLPSPNEVCGGQIDFAINRVKVTTTTTVDRKDAGNVGLKIPLDIVTISPGSASSLAVNQTITTALEIYPYTEGQGPMVAVPPPAPNFTGTPIYDALEGLRHDLLATSNTRPCFNFGDSPDPKSNMVKWGFTVTKSRTNSGKLEILIFSLGADSTSSRSVANTVEVYFIPSGIGFG